MGSGYPKGGGVNETQIEGLFSGPHIGHPILRKRGNVAFGPWWVCVGRSASDPDDEVWTQSKKLLRRIRECLGEWFDSYRSDAGHSYDKSFVTRAIGERILSDAFNKADPPNRLMHWTKFHYRDVVGNGMLSERIFDLLAKEKVIKRPTLREFRPVTAHCRRVSRDAIDRPVSRDMVWAPSEPAADLWLSTRLLLLEDNSAFR